jgi:ascorbate-specific PTS system EIIC-type component UlaA
MMFVMGALALSAADNGGMRPVLLALLVIGVLLILAGSAIALLTLRSQRRERFARIAVEQSNNEVE